MRCAGKAQPPNRNLMCKIKKYNQSGKKRRAWISRENGTHTHCPKKPAITTPLTLPQKCSHNEKIHTNSRTPFLKTAARLLTKEIRSVTLHTLTQLLAEQRETVHALRLFIAQPYFDIIPFPSIPFGHSRLATYLLIVYNCYFLLRTH